MKAHQTGFPPPMHRLRDDHPSAYRRGARLLLRSAPRVRGQRDRIRSARSRATAWRPSAFAWHGEMRTELRAAVESRRAPPSQPVGHWRCVLPAASRPESPDVSAASRPRRSRASSRAGLLAEGQLEIYPRKDFRLSSILGSMVGGRAVLCRLLHTTQNGLWLHPHSLRIMPPTHSQQFVVSREDF
jgi:hypothetical protein